MANTGKGAAFRQLQPLGDGISRDVQYWNQDQARRRREERIEEQLKFQRGQVDKREKQALYDKYVKPLNNYETGSKSLNEVQGRLLQQATEQYVPLLQILESPSSSNEDKLKAQLKLQNLNNLPERLKEVTDFYTLQHNAYEEGKKNGLVWENKDYEKTFQEGFQNFQLGLDDQGNPTAAFIDADGDGVLDVQSYEQIQKGLPTFDFQRKVNMEGIIDKLSKDLGTVETSDEQGFVTKSFKGVDPEALDFSTNKLFDNPEIITSALRENGLENTPDNIAKLKSDFKTAVLARTDSSQKTDIDQSARTAASREARLRRESETKSPVLSEAVTPSKKIWGDEFSNIDTNNVKSIGVSGVTLEALSDSKGTEITNASVQNYTYNKNGEMVVDVTYPKTKSITKNDFSELEAKAAAGDQNAIDQLELATITGDGGAKVVIPGQNGRKSIVISKEDESRVASQLGLSIEEAKSKVQKSGSQPKDNTDQNSDPLNLFN